VENGVLDTRILPVIAKHKTATPDLPATTLRYIGDAQTKAHINRTAEATILIPWETTN
jgi:hypothetical protein